MAGSLPGVEAARRRRFHQSSSSSNNLITNYDQYYLLYPAASRRTTSFCLYTSSSHDNYHHSTATSNYMRTPASQKASLMCDESCRLGAAAREAKKRLDQRLQPQWRTTNTQQRLRSLDERRTIQPDLQTERPKLKKSGSKRLNWLKLSWKSSEQEECAVCLEQFKATRRDAVMQLPCGHKFHDNCLVPWLESNAHCPCCRMEIPS